MAAPLSGPLHCSGRLGAACVAARRIGVRRWDAREVRLRLQGGAVGSRVSWGRGRLEQRTMAEPTSRGLGCLPASWGPCSHPRHAGGPAAHLHGLLEALAVLGLLAVGPKLLDRLVCT